MTGAPSTVVPPEWYLARDGEQFGPLSDTELRKLVEFGHLKPTDLLWREGFPEWRSARILLNDTPSAATAAPRPSEPVVAAGTAVPGATAPASTQHLPVRPPQSEPFQPQPADAAAQSHPSAGPAPTTTPIASARGPAAHAAPAVGTPASGYPISGFQPQAAVYGVPNGPAPNSYAAAPYAKTGYAASPSPQVAATPAAAYTSAPTRPVDLMAPTVAAPVASKQRRPQAAPVHRDGDDEEDEFDDIEEDSAAIRWLKRIAVLLFFALTLAAAGWLAYPYRDRIATTLKLSSLGSMLPGLTGAVSPLSGFKATVDATDTALQANELWRVLKREFPEWYSERLKEASTLAAAGTPDAEIGAQMMQAIVSLRRKHAGDALSATMPRLKTLATAFADNLVALRSVSVEACHAFVSSGETSPAYLSLLSDRARTAALQNQLVAVFEAIADGRKVPRIYPQPKQADYNLLVTALEARGWTDADMQLFSDSRSFGAAPPEKICKMVTDWFKAQVELNEPDAQLRLLADALKPVVAG